MSTVNSEIDVAKLALDLLKEATISSFADDTSTGRWMKRNFPIVRNMVLAQTPWGFAIKRAILLSDAAIPKFGWSTRYAIPRDCIRLLPLRVGGTLTGSLISYEREGAWILTGSSSSLKIRYIFEQLDASIWSPLFVDALSTALALRMSQWLTGKQSFTQMMSTMHRDAMTSAMFANGAEGTPMGTEGSLYDDVRV